MGIVSSEVLQTDRWNEEKMTELRLDIVEAAQYSYAIHWGRGVAVNILPCQGRDRGFEPRRPRSMYQ